MRGVNRVILIGNATRDAELRHTASNKPVTSLRLATNRQVGEQDETKFHSIVCWDGLAETVSTYVKKGESALCRGAIAVPSLHRRGRQGAGRGRGRGQRCPVARSQDRTGSDEC